MFIEQLESKTFLSLPPNTTPEPPVYLSAVALSDTSIKLSWVDSESAKDNPEDRYYIDRTFTNTNKEKITFTRMWHPNTNEFKDTGLKGNITYTYQIRSYTVNGGIGLPSDSVTIKTPVRRTKPEVPTNVKIVNYLGKMSIFFKDNSTNENNFVVRYSKTGKIWSTVKIVEDKKNKLDFGEIIKVDLPPNTGYYKILANNYYGNSISEIVKNKI